MLIDGNKISDRSEFNFDICIIGAGAAGITIARELNNLNKNVCLIESGGFDFSPENNELYTGQTTGIDDGFLTRTRLRMFGGTTNHWAGWCRPLDEYDFIKKEWSQESIGWPFTRKELIPFYDKASEIIQIKPFFSESDEQKPFYEKTNELIALPMQFSPPTRFGQLYRKELVDSKNISIFLNSNATEFKLGKNKKHIRRLKVIRNDNIHFSIKAKHFVLATGGLENPRLLLNSTADIPNGIGNQNDLVGRYFMSNAPLKNYASILLSGAHTQQIMDTVANPMSHIAIKEEIKRKYHLNNMGMYFRPIQSEKRFNNYKELALMKADFDKKYSDQKNIKILKVITEVEQSPNPDSRVTLTSDTDYTGLRKIKLDYRYNEEDLLSVDQSLKILIKEFGRLGLGRFKLHYAQASEANWKPGAHHLGTTRMHNDPKLGVVDENCKVHGVDNLFVAGSSVFPSGGFANPTFTIVALSLRLADRIKRSML